MNEIADNGATVIQHITEVITGNPRIWIPVLTAWAIAFIYTRYMNTTNLKRKSDRELRIYCVNACVAFVLYVLFNFKEDMTVYLPQATLASTVAVLSPAVWFKFRHKKE